MFGKIKSIVEVNNLKIGPSGGFKMRGSGGRMNFMEPLIGYEMAGYRIETDQHIYHVLISNGQCCCESWGYISSEDDLNYFIGAELFYVNLTDKALNKQRVEDSGYYDGDCGGIQFVDFVTDRGTFQLAVYNAHNGYYGHGIMIAKDNDIILNDTL